MRACPPLLAALLALLLSFAFVQPGIAQVTPEVVHGQLNFSSTIKFAPDGHLFCLETFTGRVMVYHDTAAVTPTVWATIPVVGSAEHGLLGLAFHPQFPDSPYVYLYHTNPNPFVNRVVRMVDSANVGIHYTILLDGLPCYSDTHQGGRLAFGPDRFLYVTVGDQYVPSNSQNTSSPLGKILRITTTGQSAPGNPFGPGNPVAAYGIRNSYGLCFDPISGQGYFTDNGPTCDDELNYFEFAANYGWGPDDSCGTQPPDTELPMWTTTPTVAPTGICAYRGSLLYPYDGNLFFCSYNDSALRRVVLQPGRPDSALAVVVLTHFTEAALDVTEGPDQRLWVVTASTIWRIGLPVVSTEDRSPLAAGWMPGPSPFTNHVTLAARGNRALRSIEVLDVSGRLLRSFSGPISASLMWGGEDQTGHQVPAGVYLLKAETASGSVMRRVVRLGR